ncbi:MAG: VTT domain-containing protein, partial [Frankia sp.]|nr:VTT domain-containing protein [Frankia sp.]
ANIAVLCVGTAVAAIAGNSTGYAIGRRAGRPLLRRRDGRVLNQHNLRRATAFYDRFGSATIVVAQFVPMVRTFAPLIAGVTEMRYRRFVTWNVIGAALWGAGVPVLGYLVGDIPGLDKISLAAAGSVVVLSLAYSAVHYVRAGRDARTGVVDEQAELLDESQAAS